MVHEQGEDPEWAVSFAPFSVDLYDAVQTAEGPYAVGGGGTVARKREGKWEAVIRDGPAGQGSTLRAIAATDGGHRVWFAGSSGALGMYDLRNGTKQNYSYPGDATTSWREIAVTGEAGEERALLANGSGVVVSFVVDGSEITFSEPTEPGQGDAVQALETTEEGVGYAIDGAGAAYRATPEGWVSLGTVNASASLTDIYADDERLLISATNGKLYTYDRPEEAWTPIDVARTGLRSIDVFQGHAVALATGATFYSRPLDGEGTWHRVAAETGNNLVALALGYPDVAVGKSGTIVERPRAKRHGEGETGEKTEEPTRDPAPPVDPCRVLTGEMVERLESTELLELVEEYGCASPFTETVAGRLELQELAEHHRRHGEPISAVTALTESLLERIRRSERYRLCCACCERRVMLRERPPAKEREEKQRAEPPEGAEKPKEAGCGCGAHGHEAAPAERATACLKCRHCGHAEFYVCRGECGGHEGHANHAHHGHCGHHGHSQHDCCGGHARSTHSEPHGCCDPDPHRHASHGCCSPDHHGHEGCGHEHHGHGACGHDHEPHQHGCGCSKH